MKKTIFAVSVFALMAIPAAAQEATPAPKQENGKKASEILAMIEGRSDFARLDDMSWDKDGYYEITYRTVDKAKVEINVGINGEPVDRD